jgi:hypothetical protein
MNRKSALFVAAGMVLTMVVAAAAMTMGIAGPSKADANVARPARQKPIVKTVVDTVTIHKKAKASGATTGTTVVRTADAATAPTTADDTASEAPEPQETEDDGSEAPEPQETESHSESPEPGDSSGNDD